MVIADILRDYELVLVLSPALEEEGITSIVDRFTQMVSNGGGEVKEIDRWGRRKLAYPIRRHLEGHYIVAQLRLPSHRVKELEANFRLWEEVLRHLLVRIDE